MWLVDDGDDDDDARVPDGVRLYRAVGGMVTTIH